MQTDAFSVRHSKKSITAWVSLHFRKVYLSPQDCRRCLRLDEGLLCCLHRLHCLLQARGGGRADADIVVSSGLVRPAENSAIFMMMHNSSTIIIRVEVRQVCTRTHSRLYHNSVSLYGARIANCVFSERNSIWWRQRNIVRADSAPLSRF